MKKYFLLLFLAAPLILSAMENDNQSNETISENELKWRDNPTTGLRIAIQQNDIEKLKAYLELGAEVNREHTPTPGTKVHTFPPVAWLLKKTLKLKDAPARSDGTYSPLLMALSPSDYTANPAIVEMLCEYGADTNEHFGMNLPFHDLNEGETPLHHVIKANLESFYINSQNVLPVIDIFLKYGAHPNAQTSFHEDNWESLSQSDFLKTLFSKTTPEPLIVGTPLDYAVGFGCLDAVKRLLVPTALALYNPTRDEEQLLVSKKRVKTWLLTSVRHHLPSGIDKKVLQYLPEDTYSAEMLAALTKQCSSSEEIYGFVHTLPHEWFEQLLKDKDFAPVTKQEIVSALKERLSIRISTMIKEKKYLDYIEERKTDPGATLYSDPQNKGIVSSLTEFFEIEDSLGVREDCIKEYYDRMNQQEIREQ